MPSGNGLGIARGIELGAQNFLNSYLQVKQLKHEEKYRKLAPVIQVIHAQIADPNTPLDQKIKAMDSLPYILDPKYSGVKLSEQLGLNKLAEQELDTGETVTQQGQKGGLVEDPNAVNFNQQQDNSNNTQSNGELSTNSTLATSINQKPTKTLKKPLLRRRGELSANDINLMKQMKLQQSEDESQFQRQYRLAQVQADLQEKVLNKNGWKNNGDWTYDENTKSWQQEWFNPITKENYQQKLVPGVVPETVILKQIQASGKSGSGGVSKAYSTLRTAIATSMGLEEDDPKVQLATANMWKTNFEAGVQYKQQGVSGTRAIQPAQQEGLGLQKLQTQQTHAALIAEAQSASDNVDSLASRKNTAWQSSADAKANFDKIKENYEPDEKEYQDAEANYRRAFDAASDLESQYQNALKLSNTKKAQVQVSEKNLNSSGISTSNAPSASSVNLSARMKTRIDIFRKKNPNANLTDEQIANILIAQGYKD
jgi:hypothetical protein